MTDDIDPFNDALEGLIFQDLAVDRLVKAGVGAIPRLVDWLAIGRRRPFAVEARSATGRTMWSIASSIG